MAALNVFLTFVSDVDSLTGIFDYLVCDKGFVSLISCPPGSMVILVVMTTKRRKVFFFLSLGISLRIYCVAAALGVLWPRGVT